MGNENQRGGDSDARAKAVFAADMKTYDDAYEAAYQKRNDSNSGGRVSGSTNNPKTQ